MGDVYIMTDTENPKIGFFGVEFFENGDAIRGAILITDFETKPYEFRITSPVRPSLIQRMLYGNSLEDYVNIEIIGIPLIEKITEKAGLILVNKACLLRIRPKIATPVVLLRSEQSKEIEESPDSKTNDYNVITINSHRDYPSDSHTAQAMLSPIMQKRDLLEPFERLLVALTEAHKQKVGDTVSKN